MSGDASRAVIVTINNGTQDIWVLEMSNGVFSRMTSDALNENDPVWSPDGREVGFTSRGNLYRHAADKRFKGVSPYIARRCCHINAPYVNLDGLRLAHGGFKARISGGRRIQGKIQHGGNTPLPLRCYGND